MAGVTISSEIQFARFFYVYTIFLPLYLKKISLPSICFTTLCLFTVLHNRLRTSENIACATSLLRELRTFWIEGGGGVVRLGGGAPKMSDHNPPPFLFRSQLTASPPRCLKASVLEVLCRERFPDP